MSGFAPTLTWFCLCLSPQQVNLYSDPPQPSHSIYTGTVPQGTKVLSFTIPQPHSVERWPGPSEASQASEASGESGRGDMTEGFILLVMLLWEHLTHTGFRPGEGGSM